MASHSIFVDTSAWVGFFAARDRHHEAAVDTFEAVGSEGRELVTTDYVLAETVTLLRLRSGLAPAARVWEELDGGATALLIEVQARQRREARRIFTKYDELVLSLTDCVSFVVMDELGIQDALSFDEDFARAGYTVVPPRR